MSKDDAYCFRSSRTTFGEWGTLGCPRTRVTAVPIPRTTMPDSPSKSKHCR